MHNHDLKNDLEMAKKIAEAGKEIAIKLGKISTENKLYFVAEEGSNLIFSLCNEIEWLRKIMVRAADVCHWYNLYHGGENFEEHIALLAKTLEGGNDHGD